MASMSTLALLSTGCFYFCFYLKVDWKTLGKTRKKNYVPLLFRNKQLSLFHYLIINNLDSIADLFELVCSWSSMGFTSFAPSAIRAILRVEGAKARRDDLQVTSWTICERGAFLLLKIPVSGFPLGRLQVAAMIVLCAADGCYVGAASGNDRAALRLASGH